MSNIMISADVIDKYWQRMSARTNDEIAVSLRSLHSRQPALMLYLMEADKENLADKERQYLYYLGCFCRHSSRSLPRTLTVCGTTLQIITSSNFKPPKLALAFCKV